ncbi:MAG: TRAM domain-containing protein [Actinophytocola sp.]|uniref:class I SAM-dependent RNA methyltransferase n=1 Tax=Actinophytocola sp. TaxID=1872138 RepID=UPI0013254D60|nr:TRAM domain-containing protein [Actinophytocola sp.]MPZ86157.1 TRAM domain-containing protein [Actinophytocola sp.]
MSSWVGRRFEVLVGPVAHGGHCVARHEGRVVFVRHTLPGERVVVSVTEDRGGSFCRGDAVAVLTPSGDRVDPPCPVARPGGCGGCDFQHASPASQRLLKASVVAEQFSRLAGLAVSVEVEPLPGGPLSWRTRARLTVDSVGRPGFRAHRSHEVVPISGCPISAPGTVDQVVGRAWPPDSSVTVAVDAHAVTHIGPGSMAVETAARRTWRVPAESFWQTHPDAADLYAEVVSSWSGLVVGDAAWDLYCGVGLFAAVLASQVGPSGEVIAVESIGAAAAAAADNLSDLPQARIFEGRVEAVLSAGVGRDPAVVVLDPPRSGAGRRVVEAISSRGPSRVIYVACDPAALARDVATFGDHGYRLERVRAFDAFPMTHHIECIALLTRS